VPIGFGVANGGGQLTVEVPASRPDVTREIDVIEEIARRRGYDTFEAELSHFRPGRVPQAPTVPLLKAVHELFARWGFREARTAAFAEAADRRVPLLNPLSSEESHLRDDLVNGLVRRVQHNWAHGVRSVRLYEIGSVFRPAAGPVPDEEVRVAAVFTGPAQPPHWSEQTRSYDIWDLKALAGELSELLRGAVELPVSRVQGDSAGSREPGAPWQASETLSLTADGKGIGTAGPLDPRKLDPPAWAEPVWGLEAALRVPASARAVVPYRELPAQPAVERDLALVVPQGVVAGEVLRVISGRGGELLEAVWPFDLYAGSGISEGARSIAWRLRFRHPGRTLTDAEVDQSIAKVLAGLEEELGVHRR
jgi:phenylalanyl-tRNA synthetase beta chain